jgi:Xaa-Pro aminopeptidase
MLSFARLQQETARRVDRLQRLMAEKDLGAVVIVGGGAPGQLGAARYFTNVDLWSGREFVVIGPEDPEPFVYIWSSYQAEWAKTMATTPRIESPDDPMTSAVETARALAGPRRRVGVVNMLKVLSAGEYQAFRQALAGYDLVEITADVNAMRVIKSPFEMEALVETGRILHDGMAAFAAAARVGVRVWDACAEAERAVKAQGCFWGRSKLSLDGRPYTIPAAVDRRFRADDVICFELVYAGPLGYWCEMTTVYSFGELPEASARLLDATLRAVDAAAEAAVPGTPIGRIAEVTDETFRALGFPVAGKHTPDCHSIGLDGSDGPNSERTPGEPLQANMVLSLHPGTVMEGDRAFLISDNFLVTPQGGVRLSPHVQYWYPLPTS